MQKKLARLLIGLALLLTTGIAGADTPDADLEAAILEHDLLFLASRQKGDWETVDRLVAADFVKIQDDVPVERDDWLAWVKAHPITLDMVEDTGRVRVYADGDVAVVISRMEVVLDGEPYQSNTTRVWVKHDDGWKLASLHVTRLPGE